QQQQHQQQYEQKFSSPWKRHQHEVSYSYGSTSDATPNGLDQLSFETKSLYNRSATLRLRMKPQTRILADSLSPKKSNQQPPPPSLSSSSLRLPYTPSGLNPFGNTSRRTEPSSSYSPSPSPTKTHWTFTLPDASSPTATPRKETHTGLSSFSFSSLSLSSPLPFMTTPQSKALVDRFSAINVSRTESDDPFPTTPQRPRTTTTIGIDTHQHPFFPPLTDAQEAQLRDTAETTLPRTPRARAVAGPEEARQMTPKSKALANLLLSKKKPSLLPSLTGAASSNSLSTSSSTWTTTSTPSISSSTSTPNPSTSPSPPPLPPIFHPRLGPTVATLLETASSFEPLPDFELGDVVVEAARATRGAGGAGGTGGGMKRQYGQDEDENGDEDFVGYSSKQFKVDNSDRMFQPRPPF
ncbi:hypothetical protein BGX29_004174, partial [Mortierella sp. GBA35]